MLQQIDVGCHFLMTALVTNDTAMIQTVAHRFAAATFNEAGPKQRSFIMKTRIIATSLAAIALAMSCAVAQARPTVGVAIGIPLPGIGIGVAPGYAPAYYGPAPVYAGCGYPYYYGGYRCAGPAFAYGWNRGWDRGWDHGHYGGPGWHGQASVAHGGWNGAPHGPMTHGPAQFRR
jgi:hypothetical protein